MNFIKAFFVVAAAYILQSCFNSDDYIFNEAETTNIKIESTLAKSLVETGSKIKADTFHIGDTIYFLTSVTPSRTINVQNYQWLMDGQYCSSDYSFKKQIEEPGHHKFTFVLKDHFGDMHYDSLEVWVADYPVLNDSAFIPAEGTQAIDPYESVYFTWSANTKGIKLNHYYHFTLSEQGSTSKDSQFIPIDTILNEPHFIYHSKLNAFKKYNWTVQAFNEYNLASKEKIESNFFTKGMPGEGALQATVDIGQASAIPVRLTLQDKENSDKHFDYKFTLSQSNNEISVGSIPAGKYRLNIKSDYPDFGTIKKDIKIDDGFTTIASSLKLIDSIPQTIHPLSHLDTLSFNDSLLFFVKDGSKAISAQNISINLEDEPVTDFFYKDSILTVILKETERSWAYRILSITATDGSKNKNTKSFYIQPSTLWFLSNNDTTIAKDDIINIFITDQNPYGFKVDTLKIFSITENETILSVPRNGIGYFYAELEASIFKEEQTLESIVIYKNGLRQSKTWKLYVSDITAKEDE